MKRKRIAAGAILAGFLAAGCQREKPASVQAEAKDPPAASSAEGLTLDRSQAKQAGVEIEEVRLHAAPEVIRATGRITVNENRTWRVGAVTEGRVAKVSVNVGDFVKEGQVLARMHSHEVHESRADYRKAKDELQRARAAESYGEKARDRARRLYELKAGSLQQVEEAEIHWKNLESGVARAEAELERARIHLEEFLNVPAEEPADATPGHSMEDHDLIPIKAPAAGTVIERGVTPGTVVQPSSDLFVISDLTTVWMIAAVNEEHLSRLRTGMRAEVHVQAYPDRPFAARLGRLGDQLDPTTRTVNARLDLQNPAGRLKSEMYATAVLEAGGARPAIFVPSVAVQELNGKPAVFVRSAPSHFEPRHVETGRSRDGNVEIVSGLREGEAIVTKGSFLLKSQLLKGSFAEE